MTQNHPYRRSSLQRELSSFRDPTSYVLIAESAVVRRVTGDQADFLKDAKDSTVVLDWISQGKLIDVVSSDWDAGARQLLLTHPVLSSITYPYEWSFGMLRAAALLHIQLHRALLAENMTLRDGSAYNVAFRGCHPIFIDFGSIGPYREGEPWAGFSQFCSLFLYPLMIASYRGLDPRMFFQASVDGVTANQARRLLRGGFKHRGRFRFVTLQALLESRHTAEAIASREVVTPKNVLLKLLASLERLISSLDEPKISDAVWSNYGPRSHYLPENLEKKAKFVRGICSQKPRRQVLDIGANDGMFSVIAAEFADIVYAVDMDPTVVDAMYLQFRDDARLGQRIVPGVLNVCDSIHGLGWIGGERLSFASRVRPDLILYLAVAHHVGITGHVPLAHQIEMLLSMAPECIFELPHSKDPKVRDLTRNMRESNAKDFTEQQFESLLSGRASIMGKLSVSETRTLYHLRSNHQ